MAPTDPETKSKVRHDLVNGLRARRVTRQHFNPPSTDSTASPSPTDVIADEEGEYDDSFAPGNAPLPAVASRLAYSYGLAVSDMPNNSTTEEQAIQPIAEMIEQRQSEKKRAQFAAPAYLDDRMSVTSSKHTEDTSRHSDNDSDDNRTVASRTRRQKRPTPKAAARAAERDLLSGSPSKTRPKSATAKVNGVKPTQTETPDVAHQTTKPRRGARSQTSKTPVPTEAGPDTTTIDHTWSGPAIKFGGGGAKRQKQKSPVTADLSDVEDVDEEEFDEQDNARDKDFTPDEATRRRRSRRRRTRDGQDDDYEGGSQDDSEEEEEEDDVEPGLGRHLADIALGIPKAVSRNVHAGVSYVGDSFTPVSTNVRAGLGRGKDQVAKLFDSSSHPMPSVHFSFRHTADILQAWLSYLFVLFGKALLFVLLATAGVAIGLACLTAARNLSSRLGQGGLNGPFSGLSSPTGWFDSLSDFSFPGLTSMPSLPSLPSLRSLPVMSLPDDVIRAIHNRLSTLERQVVSLEKQQSLHQATIDVVREIFPKRVAVSKDAHGNIIFPSGFWDALKEKISTGSGDSSQGGAPSQWSAFLHANEARIQAYMDQNLEKTFKQRDFWKRHIQNTELLSEPQLVEALNAQYDRLHGEIATEARRIEDKYRRIEHGVEKIASAVATQVAKSVAGVWQRHLPSAQLDALAQASQRLDKFNALKHINFLSPAYGAIVNPILTSNTYRRDITIWQRLADGIFGLGLPEPLPPAAALTRWEEAGDCWCTSASVNRIPQLAIVLPTKIYPSEITIEHIPTTATLDPGAAPRFMELWIEVHDDSLRAQIATAADAILGSAASHKPSSSSGATGGWRNILNSHTPSGIENGDQSGDKSTPAPDFTTLLDDELSHFNNGLDPVTWVRVARFKYDIYALSNVQTFSTVVDLRAMRVPVDDIVLRILDNWSGGTPSKKKKSDGEGGDEYTCLYRVRLHGDPADESPKRTRKLYNPRDDEVGDVTVGFSADEVEL